MKILNLYCGIGGNRKLWGSQYQITAVENNPSIAKEYQIMYPNDKLIIGDAVEYLINNYQDYDIIWASPPCTTHSRARFARYSKEKPVLPDFTLYSIISFLEHHFDGKYIVENVKPYYDILNPNYQKLGRHLFWTNFNINPEYYTMVKKRGKMQITTCKDFESIYDIKLNDSTKGERDFKLIQVYRNCVNPDVGKYVLDMAIKSNFIQMRLV